MLEMRSWARKLRILPAEMGEMKQQTEMPCFCIGNLARGSPEFQFMLFPTMAAQAATS